MEESVKVQLDNPHAFPNSGEIFVDGPQGRMAQSAWGMEGEKGMTLLDHMAGKALEGELAAQCSETGEWLDGYFDKLADRCYLIAVEMLKARKKYL